MYGGDWEDAYDRLQKAARCVGWWDDGWMGVFGWVDGCVWVGGWVDGYDWLQKTARCVGGGAWVWVHGCGWG